MALAHWDPEGWEQVHGFGVRLRWKRQDGRAVEAIWRPGKGLTIRVKISPEESFKGLREVVEDFECSMPEAREIVRQRR